MAIQFEATYSPEDNKLRLYPSERLGDDLYQRVKEAGFKWAPKQELFVAPMWTPSREDLCVELAGEITAEETTLVERAEAKAERLDALAVKRSNAADNFHAAAHRISERFAMGQPILVGHHSERKARKDRDRMDSEMSKAVKAASAVQYWNWKAEGVERHANMKNDPRVRANRIKTLLAELRDLQRGLSHSFICAELWAKIAESKGEEGYEARVKAYAGAHLKSTGQPAAHWDHWSDLENGKKTADQVVEECQEMAEEGLTSSHRMRWIQHTLNRLAYERYELGPVARFEGALTATIIKAFAREHGAHKPDAKKVDGQWQLSSSVPLPAHIADGKTLTLSDDDWKQLMKSSGYEVPAPKPKAPPILNFKAQALVARKYGNTISYPQIEMTKAEYSAIYNDYRGTSLSICGQFRFKSVYIKGGLHSVFLTDSKAHPAPESESVIKEVNAA